MISAYFFVCLLVVAPLMLFVSGAEILTSSEKRAEVKGIASPGFLTVTVPAFVASKGSSADLNRDPESVKEAVSTTYTLVGSYLLEDGPGSNFYPPTYSCQETCALYFGGVASDYAGSISDATITNTCYYDKYAGSTTDSTVLSASFTNCATYSASNCYSAYVHDHIYIQPTKNFCYTSRAITAPTMAPTPAFVPNAYRGKFRINDGPSWTSSPPTYTCQQACALIFGGSASDYQGSTSSSSITNTCYAQQYSNPNADPYLVPENYSECITYNAAGCMSTYVEDAYTNAYNYCYNHK